MPSLHPVLEWVFAGSRKGEVIEEKALRCGDVAGLLRLGCAAREQNAEGKGTGTGLGRHVQRPCPCGRSLRRHARARVGPLEATDVNDVFGGLGREEPDPKFVASMEKLQRETLERMAARRLEQGALQAARGEERGRPGPMGCSAQMPGAGRPSLESTSPGRLEHCASSAGTTERVLAENAR